MLPNVDPSAWMPFLLPWRTLLRHYMSWPLPSDWLWCLSTRRKMNMFNFCRSRIKAESKSNRNCNSHFRVKKWSAHSSKYRRFGDTASNIVPNCYIAIHNWVTIKMANESHHTTDNIRLMIRKIKHMWIQPSPSWRVHRISSWLQSTASIYQRCPAQ